MQVVCETHTSVVRDSEEICGHTSVKFALSCTIYRWISFEYAMAIGGQEIVENNTHFVLNNTSYKLTYVPRWGNFGIRASNIRLKHLCMRHSQEAYSLAY